MEALVPRFQRSLVTLLLAAALATGSLAASESSSELRLPADVTYRGAETSPGPVVFSHAVHVPLAENRCVGCHPALFAILQPTGRITHDEMTAGRKCGACHDGTKASGVQDACDHCHRTGGGS
jgi:c(7)-type cytochrome triheme protein